MSQLLLLPLLLAFLVIAGAFIRLLAGSSMLARRTEEDALHDSWIAEIRRPAQRGLPAIMRTDDGRPVLYPELSGRQRTTGRHRMEGKRRMVD